MPLFGTGTVLQFAFIRKMLCWNRNLHNTIISDDSEPEFLKRKKERKKKKVEGGGTEEEKSLRSTPPQLSRLPRILTSLEQRAEHLQMLNEEFLLFLLDQ